MTGTVPLDWLCIGAQKAGTSTLYRLLRDHPELYVPPGKEVPIFDRDATPAELDAYTAEHLPAEARAGRRAGTVTPQYLSDPATAARVHGHLPGARIVAILRDPVERARSQHRMSVRRGIEERSFAEAAGAQVRAIERGEAIDPDSETDTYVGRGLYGRLLAPWYERYGPDRVLVVWTADLDADPAATVLAVQRFLGVEPRLTGQEGLRAHEAPPPHRLSGLRRPVAGALRRVGLLERIPVERKEQVADAIERTLGRLVPVRPAEPDAGTTAALRRFYQPDGEVLAGLVGTKPPWL